MTRVGWGLAGAVAVLSAGAALSRYLELAVLAASGAAAGLVALLTVIRRPKVSVRIGVSPSRVVRGEPATVTIMVRNRSRWASPPFTVRLPHGPAPVRTDRPLPADSWSIRALVRSDLAAAWLDRVGASTAADRDTARSGPSRWPGGRGTTAGADEDRRGGHGRRMDRSGRGNRRSRSGRAHPAVDSQPGPAPPDAGLTAGADSAHPDSAHPDSAHPDSAYPGLAPSDMAHSGPARAGSGAHAGPARAGSGRAGSGHPGSARPGSAHAGPADGERAADGSGPAAEIEIAPLAGGEERVIELTLDTNRRGVVVLGPAEVARTDPFGLLARRQQLGVRDVLHVHPRVHPLASLSSAPSRDPDGQTGDGTAGGLEIHTLREYSPGEDLRLVHWPSSARFGHLMVRTHIDPSEPAVTVVLDNRPDAYPPGRVGAGAFEEAVDVAAAAVMTCAEGAFGVRLVTTAGVRVAGRRRRRDVDVLLDELAAVRLHELASLDVIGTLRRGGLGTLVLVTGGFDREALAALAPVAHAYGRVIVVRVGPRSPATARAFARRDASDRARLRSSPPVQPSGLGLVKRSLLIASSQEDVVDGRRTAGRVTVVDVASAAALPARWPAARPDRRPRPDRSWTEGR